MLRNIWSTAKLTWLSYHFRYSNIILSLSKKKKNPVFNVSHLTPTHLMQAIDRFRGNEHGILVATDVAARGLDIHGIRTVVHYQLPHSAEVSQY